MSKFYRAVVEDDVLNTTKPYITPIDLLKLLENSEFYDEVVELAQIDGKSNDQINIPGVDHVAKSIIRKDQEFEKFDLDIHLSNVSLYKFTNDGSAVLEISLNKDQQEFLEQPQIKAETKYNSKSDYFEGTYSLHKFSKFCNKEGHIELLQNTINYLNDHYQDSEKFIKSFRMLRDEDSNYYVRAITSTDNYNDYNIRFSLFVAVTALNNLMNSEGWTFTVERAEFDESHIKVFFRKSDKRDILDIGKLSLLIELSNDEIKRASMLFSTLYSIESRDKEGEFKVYVKPKQSIRTKLLSIKHNFKPDTVFKSLAELSQLIHKSEEDIAKDVEAINNTKNPDELRFALSRRLELSQNDEIKKNKQPILNLLDSRINSLNELLRLMNKVDDIVSDLEAKEYLRYLYYDILRNRKNN